MTTIVGYEGKPLDPCPHTLKLSEGGGTVGQRSNPCCNCDKWHYQCLNCGFPITGAKSCVCGCTKGE